MGDLNARVGALHDVTPATHPDILATIPMQRGCASPTTNASGHQLIDLCHGSGLILLTGRAPGDASALHTFASRTGSLGTSRPDHILIDPALFPRVSNSTVHHHRVDADHFPLSMTWATPGPSSTARALPNAPVLRWRPQFATQYIHAVMHQMPAATAAIATSASHADIDGAAAQLHSLLHTAAVSAGHLRPARRVHVSHHKPWFDAECRGMRDRLHIALRHSPGSHLVQHLRHEFNQLTRRKKRSHKLHRTEQLLHQLQHQPASFWRSYGPKSQGIPPDLHDTAGWTQHFETVFTQQPTPPLHEEAPAASPTPSCHAPHLDAPFTTTL